MFDLFKRAAEPDRRPWGERLKAGLGLSRERLTRPLNAVFGRTTLSDETLEELETALLEADVDVPATTHLLAQLAARAKRADVDVDGRTLLKAVLTELLLPLEQPLIVGPERPFVVMIAGVNGTGKTTSIGKLAKFLQGQGYSVLLAAGDTFRAAAREQLEIWGERTVSRSSPSKAAIRPRSCSTRSPPRALAASTWSLPTPRAAFRRSCT